MLKLFSYFVALVALIVLAAALPIHNPSAARQDKETSVTRHYFLHTEDVPDGFEVEFLQLGESGNRDFMVTPEEGDPYEVDGVREEGDTDPEPSSVYPFFTIGS